MCSNVQISGARWPRRTASDGKGVTGRYSSYRINPFRASGPLCRRPFDLDVNQDQFAAFKNGQSDACVAQSERDPLSSASCSRTKRRPDQQRLGQFSVLGIGVVSSRRPCAASFPVGHNTRLRGIRAQPSTQGRLIMAGKAGSFAGTCSGRIPTRSLASKAVKSHRLIGWGFIPASFNGF